VARPEPKAKGVASGIDVGAALLGRVLKPLKRGPKPKARKARKNRQKLRNVSPELLGQEEVAGPPAILTTARAQVRLAQTARNAQRKWLTA
jgi:hypothetical protein